MQLFRLAYKNIIHRKARFILTTLSVVVGVMFVAGTFTFTNGLRGIFNELSADIAGESQIIVRSKVSFGGRDAAPNLPINLQAELEKIDGVDIVEPGVFNDGLVLQLLDATVLDPAISGTPVIGLNWPESIGNLKLVEEYRGGSGGKPPSARNEFAVDILTATEYGLILGDEYEILIPSGSFAGPQKTKLVGVFQFGTNPDRADFSAQLMAFDTETAVEYLNDGFGYDQYDIYTDLNVPVPQVIATIENFLATSPTAVATLQEAGIQVEILDTGEIREEIEDSFNSIIDLFRNVLLGFAFIILLVSAFVIFNTFSIILDQRIKELGLLRAVGLSGGQLQRLVLGEAFIVGAVSTIVGFGASFAVVYGLQAFLNAQSGGDFPDIGLTINASTFISATLVGVGITMLSALPATLRSRKISPIVALREGGTSAVSQTKFIKKPTQGLMALIPAVLLAVACLFVSWILAVLLTLIATFLFFWGGARLGKWLGQFLVLSFGVLWMVLPAWALNLKLGEQFTIFGLGVIIVFFGVNLVSPLFGVKLARGFGVPIRAVFGKVGQLGVENSARNPKRTTTTAAALMIGISLFSVAVIMVGSIRATFHDTLSNTVNSDFIVCIELCDPNQSTFASTINDKINEQPQVVRSTLPFSQVPEGFKVTSVNTAGEVSRHDDIFDIVGSEIPKINDHFNFVTVNGNADITIFNGVYVDKLVADDYDLQAQSIVSVEFSTGRTADIEVVGIFTGSGQFGSWILNSDFIDENVTGRQDFLISVLLQPGVTLDQARDVIGPEIGSVNPNVQLQTRDEFNDNQIGSLDIILTVIAGFLALSSVVAILGIANTLSLSIFERTREIGLLRAIGMKRRQVRRMIRIEGLIIGIFGGFLGVGLGILFGVVTVQVMPDEFISIFSFGRWELLIIAAVLGPIVGLLSTRFAASRAGRMNILNAISEE